MLDDTEWASTSAMIDEACDLAGNALLIGNGSAFAVDELDRAVASEFIMRFCPLSFECSLTELK